MAWIAGIASIAGGLLSSSSNNAAANASKYQPWNSRATGIGGAMFNRGQLSLSEDYDARQRSDVVNPMLLNQLGAFGNSQQNQLGSDFLRGSYNTANQGSDANLQGLFGANQMAPNFFGSGDTFQQQALGAQGLGSQALQGSQGGYGGQSYLQAGQNFLGQGYQNQDFLGGVNGGMLGNFNPNDASSNYTNLLRQQAQPMEQQAASSALTSLFGSGRLGTTGGQNAYGQLINQQNQADIGRQVAGQQFGLQQQLQAQQGYDAARANQQGLMLNQFGANQAGQQQQFGLAQQLGQTGAGLYGSSLNNAGMGLGIGQAADQFGFSRQQGQADTGFNRAQQLYTSSDTATQDRFNRALQLFGGENAIGQQALSNYQGLLGSQQSQQQQLLDLGRLGSSVGTAQTAANANAAQYRNQGNQDLIAGFLGAANAYSKKG